MAVGGKTFPADPAGAVAVGVTGLADVVDVPGVVVVMLVGMIECCPEIGVARGLPVSRTWIARCHTVGAAPQHVCCAPRYPTARRTQQRGPPGRDRCGHFLRSSLGH